MGKINIKISSSLVDEIKKDLQRPHSFAHERAGFCFGKSVQLANDNWIVIINEYEVISDDNYIETDEACARINSEAIRLAYQKAYSEKIGLFHIHMHEFTRGIPEFSYIDNKSIPQLAKSVQSYSNQQVHGMIVLSQGSINAKALLPQDGELLKPYQISIIGNSTTYCFPKENLAHKSTNRYSRQSFLGDNAEDLFSRLKIGVIGLSGGGSHIVQQIAHIGFLNYALSDPERIDDDSNLNRVVGATLEDAKKATLKFNVSKRVISNLHPKAKISGGPKKWQEIVNNFKDCDFIFSCLDTVIGRRDLELFCRRYFIPMIDIGMGINQDKQETIMYGQIQVSTPGKPCLICNGFLTEESLAKEANNYGQKTKRPQVVWSNGVLASTAIGVLMEIITNWSGNNPNNYYLSYEGHLHVLSDHIRKKFLPKNCPHFPIKESGPISY